jgi:15-cis-phytoene synthase
LSHQGLPTAADIQLSGAVYAYCEDILRRNDQDRWLASLFVPHDRRRHVHALYAFSYEMARVNEVVSEPLLGEIRFQWWRDALEGTNQGDALANPVSAALLDTVARFSLPAGPLLELIEARARCLYEDEIGSVCALESYLDSTCSNLFRLVMLVLDGGEAAAGAAASGHAGIAYGLVGLMRSLPWQWMKGKLFVPSEVLAKHGVRREQLLADQAPLEALAVLADLRALTRSHLDAFQGELNNLSGEMRPALLVASLCEPYLRLMEKRCFAPFKTIVELPQWKRQWILWRASRRWS